MIKTSTATTPDLAAELLAKYKRQFMTRKEAADELGFSVRTINRMIDAGELAAYQVGRSRSLRLRTADVAALVSRAA